MGTDKNTTTDQPFDLLESYNKHYINIDDRGRVVDGWSDGPQPQRQPTEQTVMLTDQGGYQFRLRPGGGGEPRPVGYGRYPPLQVCGRGSGGAHRGGDRRRSGRPPTAGGQALPGGAHR